jgi:hypothetical protein
VCTSDDVVQVGTDHPDRGERSRPTRHRPGQPCSPTGRSTADDAGQTAVCYLVGNRVLEVLPLGVRLGEQVDIGIRAPVTQPSDLVLPQSQAKRHLGNDYRDDRCQATGDKGDDGLRVHETAE